MMRKYLVPSALLISAIAGATYWSDTGKSLKRSMDEQQQQSAGMMIARPFIPSLQKKLPADSFVREDVPAEGFKESVFKEVIPERSRSIPDIASPPSDNRDTSLMDSKLRGFEEIDLGLNATKRLAPLSSPFNSLGSVRSGDVESNGIFPANWSLRQYLFTPNGQNPVGRGLNGQPIYRQFYPFKDREIVPLLRDISIECGLPPDGIPVAMSLESGFRTWAQHPGSKATGLIQVLPGISQRELGLTSSEIQRMSMKDQIRAVVRPYFLKRVKGSGNSDLDLVRPYLVIFAPAFANTKSMNTVVYSSHSPEKWSRAAYHGNSWFDSPQRGGNGNGSIEVWEIAQQIKAHAKKWIPILDHGGGWYGNFGKYTRDDVQALIDAKLYIPPQT